MRVLEGEKEKERCYYFKTYKLDKAVYISVVFIAKRDNNY